MPWLRGGTVSVTNGSTAVTGTNAAFDANARVGDAFVGPDGLNYEIANVASATVISILPAYKGATVSGATYAIMPVQGYPKLMVDAFNQLRLQFGEKLAALGTTGNYDTLPVNKGGTGGNSASGALDALALRDYTQNINVNGFGVRGSNNTLANQQGGYAAWNESGAGEMTFICNKGAGAGGFVWRTINSGNTVESSRMVLSGAGVLTVPSLTLGSFLTVANGGTGGNTQATARGGLGLGGVSTENVVPQTKGGTGRTDGRVIFSEVGVQQAAALYSTQGLYIGWNAGSQGEGHFICNQGGGIGGFTWRTVNANNTATGPVMTYAQDGTLTVPAGAVPSADGNANMGRANLRWANYYGVAGAINTSDAREKTPVSPMTSAEIEASMLLGKEIGTFQWLESIKDKGDEARKHVGMTVQRAIELMTQKGLDPMAYAFICYDEWPSEREIITEEIRGNIYSGADISSTNVLVAEFEPYKDFPFYSWEETSRQTVVTKEAVIGGNRYGFRYDQLALFIARGQEERLKRLEALMTPAA